MYYHKRCVDGTWLDFKFSSDEVAKTRSFTILEGLKTLAEIETLAGKKGVALTPETAAVLLSKAAPDYESLAQDIIADGIAKKKAAQTAAQTAAKAA